MEDRRFTKGLDKWTADGVITCGVRVWANVLSQVLGGGETSIITLALFHFHTKYKKAGPVKCISILLCKASVCALECAWGNQEAASLFLKTLTFTDAACFLPSESQETKKHNNP